MSNVIPAPITNLLEVREGLLDFSMPALTVLKPSNLKAININQTNTYSSSQVSVKFEIPNEFNVVDRLICYRQLFTCKITGSSTTDGEPDETRPIYELGSFAPRSNALSKIINTATLTFGGSSYSMQLGACVDMLERYNEHGPNKYLTSLSPTMLDTSTTNDDFQFTARNPLGIYNTSSGDTDIPRGTYTPINITKNSPTEFDFQILLEMYLPISPLHSNIYNDGVGSPYGLTHLTSLNLDLTFFSGALGQRLFSFSRNRSNNNILSITNMNVKVEQPEFRYYTVSTNYDNVPNLVYYPLKTIERMPQNYVMPYGTSMPISSPVITISRIPTAVIFALKPAQSVMQFNNQTDLLDGSQYSDSFTRLDNLTVLFDGAALLSNSKTVDFYKMNTENNGVDSYPIYSGLPLVNGMAAVNDAGDYLPTYFSPSGSCTKLTFGKDISLRRNLCPMMSYRSQFQITANYTNYNKNVSLFEFVVIMCYDNTLSLFDANLSAISYAPLSESDSVNAHKMNEFVHSDVMRDGQLNGSGFFGGINKFIHHAGVLAPHIRSLYDSESGKHIRNKIKEELHKSGHHKVADALKNIGFGEGAMSGGASAHKKQLKHNLL